MTALGKQTRHAVQKATGTYTTTVLVVHGYPYTTTVLVVHGYPCCSPLLYWWYTVIPAAHQQLRHLERRIQHTKLHCPVPDLHHLVRDLAVLEKQRGTSRGRGLCVPATCERTRNKLAHKMEGGTQGVMPQVWVDERTGQQHMQPPSPPPPNTHN